MRPQALLDLNVPCDPAEEAWLAPPEPFVDDDAAPSSAAAVAASTRAERPESSRARPPVDRLPTAETIKVCPTGNPSQAFLAAKRGIDIVGALAALVVLSPVLVGAWLVLWVTTKGHPFYCGQREGLCGRSFRMFKFRTMRLDADKVQHLVANERGGAMFKNVADPRVTRVGRFLRAFSIDELPQLLNVLRGEMSLVGPRPMVPAQDNVYRAWQLRRLSVKPGITGLWQVSGRSDIGFEDMVRLDIRYIRNQSLALDLWLLWKTPLVVLSGKGAY